MARKIISQAEAYRLRKRLRDIEELDRVRMNRYRSSYPGGVHALTFSINDVSQATLDMAVKLDCALVAKIIGDSLYIYAVPRK